MANYPDNIVVGYSNLPDATFKRNKVSHTGRFTIDLFVTQNFNHAPVGDKGICTGGYWEGWATYNERINVDVAKYRAWVKSLPNDLKWLCLDIEANNGEFVYTSQDPLTDDLMPEERTARAYQTLHQIAREEKPFLNFSLYCESAINPNGWFAKENVMPRLWNEPASSPYHKRFKDRMDRKNYGIDGKTDNPKTYSKSKRVSTRGLFDCNELLGGWLYAYEDWSKDEVARACDWTAKVLNEQRSKDQKIGAWINPLGEGIQNDVGANLNKPMSLDFIAHLGASMRRSGFDAALLWAYQSDGSSLDQNGSRIDVPTDLRDKIRADQWQKQWFPMLDTFCSAFI